MNHFILTYWRDIVEIYFFSTIFYYCALWLKKDRSNNLLAYFYGFMLLHIGSYVLNLSSISTVLFYCWPVIVILFILMHQTTLQRNFVALKKNNSLQHTSSPWLETLISHYLLTLSNNKPVYCIIEHTDSLHAFIQTPINIQAPISKDLLELIHASNTFDPYKMVWVTTQGTLHALNSVWLASIHSTPIPTHQWLNDSMLHTYNTDSVAFFGDPITNTFTLIIKNKTIPTLNAHQLLQLLTKEYSLLPGSTPAAPVQIDKQSSGSKQNLYRQTNTQNSHKNNSIGL